MSVLSLLLPLVPALSLGGFVLLALAGRRLGSRGVAIVGVGSVALSTIAALVIAAAFLRAPGPGAAFTEVVWQWFAVAGLAPRVAFHLDALALVMVLVVTVVGLLIHLYSVEFMRGEEGYARFFAYMNLFVGSMLVLVLADNLLLLYLGWEGVGLSSYLLIGFWYRDPANGYAGQKAFIVTRVGDAALAVGLFLLASRFGTLDIQPLMARASAAWPVGAPPAIAAAALLLGGAVGKSAQLPLQTWLPDAMAGPTPVSALIHAATMVTAGVYLIARMHGLFALAPPVETAVAVIGAVTLLLAGASALVQRDIKRVLAYSTISQIGYMFLALGVGAWSAAIFHLMTHAFFKALLFLAAGVLIATLHHEHDIFRMGGLRRTLPVTFWTFLIGAAALEGFPLVTAGFYSKDLIESAAWSSGAGGPWLWAAAWIGTWLSAIYIFRLVFVVFFGPPVARPTHRPGLATQVPLVILAALSVLAGFLDMPPELGGVRLFSAFLETAVPPAPSVRGTPGVVLTLLAIGASLLGIVIAWLFFLVRREWTTALATSRPGAALTRFWLGGWGFDRVYDLALVQPFVRLARIDRDDVIDLVYTGLARLGVVAYNAGTLSETGRLRWYAGVIAAGTVVIVAIAVLV